MALGGSVAGVARVIMEADTRRLRAGLLAAERDVKGFAARGTSAMAGFVKSFGVYGGAAGAAGLGLLLKSSIDAASDLNEEISRSKAIFGESAASVRAWSTTASESLKISQREALNYNSAIGSMFKTIGFGGPTLIEMSRKMVQLGADMASFNNQDPAEMLQRLRSGLAGEAEPLRQFGVFLSEAAVKAEAYSSGIAKTGATLTEAEKVQARYNLILKSTVDQQGDVARTGDQVAGQQRELAARVEDLQAALGQALLPVMARVLETLNDWATSLSENKELQDDIADAVNGFTEAAGDSIRIIDGIADAMGGWEEASKFILTGVLVGKLVGLTRAFTVLAGAEAAAGAAGAAGAGVGLAGAAGQSSRLLMNLKKLGAIGAITISVELLWKNVFKDAGVPNDWKDIVGIWKKLLTGEAAGMRPPGQGGAVGAAVGQALGAAGRASGGPSRDSGGSSTAPGRVSLSPGADRAGTKTKQVVLDFLGAVSQQLGGQLIVVGTGTAHNRLTSEGNVSQHWTGNAADVPSSGASLTALGRAALIAAGAPRAWAMRQKGGLYNIGSYQIIFNSNIGGNHFNHLHVGVRDGSEIPGAGRGNATGGGGPVSNDTSTDAAENRIARAALTPGEKDDLAALRAFESQLEKQIENEKNVKKQTALLNTLRQTREDIKDITDGDPKTKPRRRTAADFASVPTPLRILLERAEATTKNLNDDIVALDKIVAYLEKQLGKAKKGTERYLEILQALNQFKSQRRGAEASLVAGAGGAERDPGVASLISSQGKGSAMGGPERSTEITTEEGVKLRDEALADLAPERARLKAWGTQLWNMREAKRGELKLLKASLAKALGVKPAKLRDPVAIQRLRNKIAAKEADIKDLDVAIDDVFDAWGELDSREVDRLVEIAGGEAERKDKPPPDSGGGSSVGSGDEGAGGGATAGITPEQVEAMNQERMTASYRFFQEFAPDVFTGGPLGLGLGSSLPGGGGRTVVVQPGASLVSQTFQTPPPDQFAYFQSAQFAAEHSLDG